MTIDQAKRVALSGATNQETRVAGTNSPPIGASPHPPPIASLSAGRPYPEVASAAASAPSISVIIAALNAERTVGQTLASLTSQEVPPTEIILVDDNSDDRTIETAKRFESQLPLLVVKKRGPRGLWSSRNLGVEIASSEYVSFADADDLVLPNHIHAHQCLANPDRLVDSRVIYWQTASARLSTQSGQLPASKRLRLTILRRNILTSACTLHRERFLQIGGYRPHVTEDWDLAIRLLRLGLHAVRTDEPTYIYRRTAGSLSMGSDIFARNVFTLRASMLEANKAELRYAQKGMSIQRALYSQHLLSHSDESIAQEARLFMIGLLEGDLRTKASLSWSLLNRFCALLGGVQRQTAP